MNDYRCPRCQHADIIGRRRGYGERTIVEYFCPKCDLMEIADSDQPNYAEVTARWRKPDQGAQV